MRKGWNKFFKGFARMIFCSHEELWRAGCKICFQNHVVISSLITKKLGVNQYIYRNKFYVPLYRKFTGFGDSLLNLQLIQNRVKRSAKIRLHAGGSVSTSPKKQDNSRRLRSMDNSKLVFSEVQKHLSKSSGFFFFMRVVSLLLLIFISGELIAQTDQQLLAFEK